MKVLLLRPHDFLVERVTALLRELGLSPVRVPGPEGLAATSPDGVTGCIVSVAPTSAVKASVREVVQAARAWSATTPIVLTGLAALERSRDGLNQELAGLQLRLLSLSDAKSWGTPGTIAYVNAEDLKGDAAHGPLRALFKAPTQAGRS